METINRTTPADSPTAPTGSKPRRSWLRWLAAILAVAILGVGAWLAIDAISGDDLLPSDVQAAMDDYEGAWRGTNEAAFLAATTDDYTFVANGIQTNVTTQAFNVGVMSYWKIEMLEQTVEGEGPYIVTTSEIVYPSALSDGMEGTSVVTIEEVNGAWKVSRHVWNETS